jgi:D-glycero-D-manno-heptose 1,7-bisphosphate phosphatase
MKRAVFIDRDGTLIEEAGYLDRLERLVFFPFAIDAVRLLKRAEFAVVIVTNQAGVGRGIYLEQFVHATHDVIAARLAAAGTAVDGFYYCPHHPDATVPRYRMVCDCRKPAAGMLHTAAVDLQLDLARSFAIGDKWSDVQAGHAAGTRSILVRTGYGRAIEESPPEGIGRAIVVDNLIAAAASILRER